MSKKLFYMVLGGFIFTTISVLSYTLASGEVLYETIDEVVDSNSNGYIDVKDALDELYDRIGQGGTSSYTINFNTDGGNSVASVDTVSDSTNYMPNTVTPPTKEGYYFLGWYDAASGGNRVTTTTPITEDTTLYAYWVHTTATEKEGVNYFTTAQEVLYNPKTRSKCQTVGTSTPGQMSDCMKWYAYAEKDGIVYMLLDHNIATGIKWYDSSSGNNTYGPLAALASLKTKTDNAGWTTTVQGNYSTYKGYGDKKFTIDYASEGYKARLLTAQEVAYITGKDTWNERTSTDYFNFGSLNETTYSYQTAEEKAKQESFGWLFANLYDCSSNGCGASNNSTVSSGNKAYWTSSPLAGSSSNVWIVYTYGYMTDYLTYYTDNGGIRPVITVSTSEVFS